jgi:hypothetical protein
MALIRRFQPDDATRAIPNLDHLPVEQLDSLFDRRLIAGALEHLRRFPHMIVLIEDVKSIVRHRPPSRVARIRWKIMIAPEGLKTVRSAGGDFFGKDARPGGKRILNVAVA